MSQKKLTVEALRNDAQRQIKLLQDLLQRGIEQGHIKPFNEAASPRPTWDTKSVEVSKQVLSGESYKLDNLDLVLAVVGTMKAGKSTSINAIVGAEVLPNRNRPMTALPTLIRHTLGTLEPELSFLKVQPLNQLLKELAQKLHTADADLLNDLGNEPDMAELLTQIKNGKPFQSKHVGEESIFNFLKGLNDLVRLSKDLHVEFPFEEYSTVDALPVIEIEFTHLNKIHTDLGRLTLLDTPGPNEAGQPHLHHMLKDQLKKASAVLAILDYTQLKSDADEKVRENLLEVADSAQNRMYALVNKFDQNDRNSDDAKTVQSYVSQSLMKGEMPLEHVFPVSSKHGYLASRALNEIDRGKPLDSSQGWVKDFAKEAEFGRGWEKTLQNDPEEVKEGAEWLWEKSRFAAPLGQVVVKAYQNASLHALSAAAKKLFDDAKKTEDFFKASEAALKQDADKLKKTIEQLNRNIQSLKSLEEKIEQDFTKSKDEIKGILSKETKAIHEDISTTMASLLIDGEERAASSLKEAIDKRHAKSRPFSSKKAQEASRAEKIQEAINSKKSVNGTVMFDDKKKALEYIGSIEVAIEHLFKKSEDDLQKNIGSSIKSFEAMLSGLKEDALAQIQASTESNLDDLDIHIKMPSAKAISLNSSTSGMFQSAMQEKTKKITVQVERDGFFAKAARWFDSFGTQRNWGMDETRMQVSEYPVNLNEIKASVDKAADNMLQTAQITLGREVYPQLAESIESVWGAFRKKIESISGDLRQGLEGHKQDDAQRKAALQALQKALTDASGLLKDAEMAKDQAEDLFKQQGV